MPTEAMPEATLPSVVTSLSRSAPAAQLALTIIFHPDPALIGARCLLEPGSSQQFLLGRHSPHFSPVSAAAGSTAQTLRDPHVSREALRARLVGSDIVLTRCEGACRCRVNGRELATSRTLTASDLAAGVRIFLAHGIVLLLRRTVFPIEPELPTDQQARVAAMVGDSFYMKCLHAQIVRAATTGDDVLILGESGTGKELVAEALHALSGRCQAPFVAVNMAAIPAGLAPTLLFGSSRGAYTGAAGATRGYFEQAESGDLFLDEVGETPAEIQAQLLRVLQQREIQPVGAPTRKIDVRVISATDADLDATDCGFKTALRHRLGAIEIVLCPLREHPEDIGRLAWHFLAQIFEEQDKQDLLPDSASTTMQSALWAELFHLLLGYHWPGNIRELVNRLRQVASASQSGLVVPTALYDRLSPQGCTPREDEAPRTGPANVRAGELDAALHRADYQVARVARELNISRQAVYRHIASSPDLRLAADIPLPELLGVLEQCAGDLASTAQQLKISPQALRTRLRDSEAGTATSQGQ